MIRIFCIVFSLHFLSFLQAQDSVKDSPLLDFFEKPKKVQWVKHYKGRIDDLNDVAISLAFDGKNCKGELLYLRSKEIFDLVGILKKDKIILQEIDQDQNISGYLKGELKEDKLKLDWSNTTNSIGGRILLNEVAEPFNVPTYCGDNKWIRLYKGLIGREKVELFLHKESSQAVNGTAYFKNKNKTFQVRGFIDAFDNVNLNIKDHFDQLQGKLEGTFDEKQKFNANFLDQSHSQTTCSFYMKNFLLVGCIEYADYSTSYDVLYPKTQNASFNKWVEQLTEEWIKSCKLYSIETKKHYTKMEPALRSAIRANVWCSVDYYSDKLISGMLTFSNTWTSEEENRVINFDLKKNVEINTEDIFKSDFDYRELLRGYLNDQISKHELYKNLDYREWLSKEDFPFFTIRKDGINFSTKFNPIFGQQEVLIPYTRLKGHIRKKSIIVDFLK